MKKDVCKAVLFDLDGVIVFTDTFHYLGWKRLADEKGWRFDKDFNHNLRGVSRLESLDLILEYNGLEIPEDEKHVLADRKNRYYVESLKSIDSAALVPGALPFIETVKNRGLKTAVCSSSRNAELVLQSLDIWSLFDTVVSGNDITRSKPDPEIFLLGAERLGMGPENCLVIEDAGSGIEAALQGGMRVAGFGGHDKSAAHVHISSFLNTDLDQLLAGAGFKKGGQE